MTREVWLLLTQISMVFLFSFSLALLGLVPSWYRLLWQRALSDGPGRRPPLPSHDKRIDSRAIGPVIILTVIGCWTAIFTNPGLYNLFLPNLVMDVRLWLAVFVLSLHVLVFLSVVHLLARIDAKRSPEEAEKHLWIINATGAASFYALIVSCVVVSAIR